MAIYRFSDVSPIQEIAVHSDADRTPTALITANGKTDVAQIIKIRREIEEAGWLCVPVVNGHEMLQIDGFGSQETLFTFLSSRGLVTGQPQVTQTAANTKHDTPKVKAKEFFGRYSLLFAGVLNLIGDAGMLGGGIKTGDKEKVTAGALYTLGGLNLTLFGRKRTQENRLEKVSARTAEFMQAKIGTLPEDTALQKVETRTQDAETGKVQNFLYGNAANNTLAAYTAGAGAMLASGIRKNRAEQGSAALYYGISSLMFKGLSFLTPEKAKQPENEEEHSNEEKKAGIIGGIKKWIQEKPLRIFGYGSLLTDSMLALDTYQEYKHNPQKKNYLWTGLTAATYLLADVMMAISNKNNDNAGSRFGTDEQRRVEALAAETIARQPTDKQDELIERTGDFLYTQPETRGKRTDIVKSIKQQVYRMKDNPWAARVTTAPQEIVRNL